MFNTMAVTSNPLFLSCLLFPLLSVTLSVGFKLNVPKVLLPFNLGVPTKYNLEVTGGGCYKWTSSRPDVAIVEIVSETPNKLCSAKALVSVTSRVPSRMSTMIIAEDEASGITLKCDVIVDAIQSIEIVTTTQELFLDDAPEALEVRAKNDQGDTFSSLGGIPFDWSFVTEEISGLPQEKQSVLRHLKFADSPYKRPESQYFWERQDLYGSVILVEGINTGSAKVTVRINDPFYKNVKEQEVSLIVVANLVLNPAHNVFLLPQSTVHYRVEIIKQQKAYEIPMPSEQYYLEVVNPDVAVLDPETSVVTALKEGETSIELKDRNMKSHESHHKPSAGIFVVEPSYLTFHIEPGDNFALQEYTTYAVTIRLYDVRHHRIHLSDNLRLRVSFPSHYFHVNFSSLNGTYHVVRTLNPGPCKIRAELLGTALPDGSTFKLRHAVDGIQDVIIYQSIKITPSYILLPWDPVSKPTYTLSVKASGGTNFYRWHSSNTSIASLSFKSETSDTATVTVHGPGETSLIVTDVHNSLFTQSGQLLVQPIADIDILPTLLEAELGNSLILPVALYGYEDTAKTKRKVFDDCSKIPLSVEIVDKARFQYDKDAQIPPMGKGCQSIQFTCKSVGYTRIYVKYEVESVQLKTTTVIACHKPLKPVSPVRAAVLAIGTTKEVAFEGGPRPWPLHEAGHFTKLSVDNKSLVGTTMLLDPYRYNRDLHVYRVLCKDFGETNLVLSIGNEPSPTNMNPASNTASVKIVCGHPHSVHLKTKLKDANKKKASCPVPGEALIVPVHNKHDLEIEVWVKDEKGRKFANITSFDMYWDLSDSTLGKLKNFRDSVEEVNGASGYRKLTRNYQVLYPQGKDGRLTVTAKIKGYRRDVLSKEGATLTSQAKVDPPISSSLQLEFVGDAEVKPDKVSVFNHPSNKVTINISRGSGYFHVEPSVKNKADIVYNENTKQIEVTPLEDGPVDVMVHDLCLDTTEPAVARVQISGVSKIEVKMVDKVQIGKSITAVVEILDSERERLPASVFPLMNLHPIAAADNIVISLQSLPQADQFQATYVVKGVALGQTNLVFVTGHTDDAATEAGPKKVVSSRPLPIQVFDSLHVHPKNITLIVGAAFQVICTGGPQPYSDLEYVIQDSNIASVFGAGIVSASKLGKTVLTVRAVGPDKDGGQIIYSQAQVSVYVVALHGIKIHSPLTRMQVGTEMPIYAVGLNEHEIPFAFGSASPKLMFRWVRDNPEVASLETEHKKGGLQQAVFNNFYARVVAHNPGLVTVKVEVEVLKAASEEGHMQLFRNSVFRSETQIHVFAALALAEPNIHGGSLLISPGTQTPLKTNRNGLAQVAYSLLPAIPNQVPLTSINSQGLLTSSSQSEEANLVITAMEEFNIVQRHTVLVKVKPVSYLMTTAITAIRTEGSALNVIPLGTTMAFSVTFHDNVGQKFHATKAQLKFRPSRYDLVQLSHGVENGTIIVRALLPGETVVKVWDSSNPVLTDFINIVVGPAIDPYDAIVGVGDVLCFFSPLLSNEGQPGHWHVQGKSVEVHPTTGIGVAVDTGVTSVFYNVSSTYSTNTQVLVTPSGPLTLDVSRVHHLTNVPQEKPHTVTVYIGEEAKKRKGNRLGRQCNIGSSDAIPSSFFQPPFTCSVSFTKQSEVAASDIFATETGFDIAAGHYFCRLVPLNKVPPYHSSKIDSDITITIEKWPSASEVMAPPTTESQSIVLPFMPAFFVHVPEISLNHIHRVALLPVTGIPSALECIKTNQIHVDDSWILEVLPPKVDAKQPNTLLFPIHLQDVAAFIKLSSPLYLTVECLLIHQHVKIPVVLLKEGEGISTYHLPATTQSLPGWSSSWWWLLDTKVIFTVVPIIVAAVFLFFGYSAIFGQRYTVASPQAGYFINSPPPATRGSPTGLPYTPMQAAGDSSAVPRPHLWTVDSLYGTPSASQKRSSPSNSFH